MKKSIYEILEPDTLFYGVALTPESAAYVPVLISIAISLKRIADNTSTLQSEEDK